MVSTNQGTNIYIIALYNFRIKIKIVATYMGVGTRRAKGAQAPAFLKGSLAPAEIARFYLRTTHDIHVSILYPCNRNLTTFIFIVLTCTRFLVVQKLNSLKLLEVQLPDPCF